MVGKGSWVAHAGDERRSTIEVYQRDLAIYPGRAAGRGALRTGLAARSVSRRRRDSAHHRGSRGDRRALRLPYVAAASAVRSA